MASLALDRIRLTHVRIPLVEPFVISNGSIREKDAILVELLAQGLTGLGEASPMAGSFYGHHSPPCRTSSTPRTWKPATAGSSPR